MANLTQFRETGVCVYCVYILCVCLTRSYVEWSLVTLQQREHLTALSVNMFLSVCVCVRACV